MIFVKNFLRYLSFMSYISTEICSIMRNNKKSIINYKTREKELEEQIWEYSNIKEEYNFAKVYPVRKIIPTIHFLRN